MATEKVYAKGIRCFPKHEKQPSFVLGAMVITIAELNDWVKQNEQYLTDYNGQKQLKFQILQNDKGINLVVDTYKAGAKAEPAGAKTNDLPF